MLSSGRISSYEQKSNEIHNNWPTSHFKMGKLVGEESGRVQNFMFLFKELEFKNVEAYQTLAVANLPNLLSNLHPHVYSFHGWQENPILHGIWFSWKEGANTFKQGNCCLGNLERHINKTREKERERDWFICSRSFLRGRSRISSQQDYRAARNKPSCYRNFGEFY